MGLLPQSAKITGSAKVAGSELIGVDKKIQRSVRGKKLAMIFQDPLSALNPVHRVGDQIAEMIQAHQDVNDKQAPHRAVELLDLVGIPQPDHARPPVPARVLGRHAPAGDDRHGDRQRPARC